MNEEHILRKLRVIADFQFGEGAGDALFTPDVRFIRSKTGRISQIVADKGARIATLRSTDGLFTLGIEGANRLHRAFKYPALRVIVRDDVSDFIKKGKTVFCKHVVDADPEIKAGDEVIVVNEQDELLATGKAVLSRDEMLAFERGMAVKVRKGISE
ncbi:pseudouridine synthase [Methanosarcinales archaeon]|nr:MAG: pseudouridine synthase [Methanosarcinales archaeon]